MQLTPTVPWNFREQLETFGPIGQPTGLCDSPALYAIHSDGSTRRVAVLDDAWDRHPGRPHLVIDALTVAVAATADTPHELDRIVAVNNPVVAIAVYVESSGNGAVDRLLVAMDNRSGSYAVTRCGDGPPTTVVPDFQRGPWDDLRVAMAGLLNHLLLAVFANHLTDRPAYDLILEYPWDPSSPAGDTATMAPSATKATALHLHAAIVADRAFRPGEVTTVAAKPLQDHLHRLVDAHPEMFDAVQQILAGLGLPPLERTYVVRVSVPFEFTIPAASGDQARIQAYNALGSLDASGGLAGAHVDWTHLNWLSAAVRRH